MRQYKSTLIYGFTIFAMFFGSGNLVFPIQIGYTSGSNWFLGFLGLFTTGIMLPFMGLFVIKIHRGSYDDFFQEAGGLARVFIPLFSLSLLGSFAVVPRCIIVAYGSFSSVFPEITLAMFSIIFCIIIFVFCLKDQLMIKLLGKWMSPILLIALLALILLGIYYAPRLEIDNNAAFIEGFLSGYQTMDLFAAFFFSSLVFFQIQDALPRGTSHKEVLRIAIWPSILGASLLGVIYLGFVFLGAHYSSLLNNIAPESMLPIIVMDIMGDKSAVFIAIIMLLSCLTTAIALINIYSRYICSSLKIRDNKFWIILLCTIGVSLFISLLDFQVIARLLAPALEVSYPGLIALTILSILFRGYKKTKICVFYGITLFMLVKMIFWN